MQTCKALPVIVMDTLCEGLGVEGSMERWEILYDALAKRLVASPGGEHQQSESELVVFLRMRHTSSLFSVVDQQAAPPRLALHFSTPAGGGHRSVVPATPSTLPRFIGGTGIADGRRILSTPIAAASAMVRNSCIDIFGW